MTMKRKRKDKEKVKEKDLLQKKPPIEMYK